MRVRRLGARRRRSAARARTEGQRHERHRRGVPARRDRLRGPPGSGAAAPLRRRRPRSREDSSSRPPASGTSGSRPPRRSTRTPPHWSRPSSAEVQRERAAAIGPWIGTGSGSTPVYLVPATQRRVRVNLAGGGLHGRRTLQRAFASVPLPPDARPAPGTDRHLTVWQPSTDRLWEFFGARHDADGWHARWGGAIRRVSQSPGYYTGAAWPGAARNWGATASSLPVIGGTMMLDELKARAHRSRARDQPPGSARGGLRLAGPADGRHRRPHGASRGSAPASRPRRWTWAPAPPKLTRMIALAAQRYGLVVRDQTHHGISLFGEVPTQASGTTYRR